MNKKIKLLSLILLVGFILSALAVAAFADDDDEGKVNRVDVVNAMGYDFPDEGDTEIPKYKIIYPDGSEYVSYVAIDMYDDSLAAPAGSTFVLLSDLYQSASFIAKHRAPLDDADILTDTYRDRSDDCMSIYHSAPAVYAEDGSLIRDVLNFDFAGHTVFSDYKGDNNFFTATGESAVLNVYSSKPGARLMLFQEKSTSSGSVLGTSSGATVNLGDYLDENGEIVYPGENLSTYSAGGFSLGSGVTMNIMGITMYRVGTDHVAYYNISGNNSVMNFTRARAFGVGRYLQIACREDKDREGTTYNNVVTFEDCIISNIGSPSVVTGAFFRYMADDNKIYFKNTVFDTVSFTCEKYFSHSGLMDTEGNIKFPNARTAVISFDEKCSYNQLPDVKSMKDKAEDSVKFAMFQFPELAEGYGERGSGVPEYILSDGLITDVYCMEIAADQLTDDGFLDLEIHDLLAGWDDLSGMFTLPYAGYEDDVVEVTWEYNGVTSEPELWLKGENPTPYTINVPRDTEYIKYNTLKVYEEGNYAFYTVTPEVNLSVKVNFTLGDKTYINVYVPVYEDFAINDLIYRMSVGGTVTKVNDIIENEEIVEIDGQSYYKIVTPIEYSRLTDKIVFTIDVPNSSKTAKAFTITKRIEFTSIMKDYIEGDGTESFKKSIGDVLYYIYKVTAAPTAIQEISDYVNANFADRIAADQAAADSASGSSTESFIDKLLGKIKK